MSESRNLDPTLFDNGQQLNSYLQAMRARFLPLKFAFVGPAAHTHDQLVRSREYGLADVEAALIRDRFGAWILPRLNGEGLNVVDVGSGNGMKALVALQILRQKFQDMRFIGLDYSEELLRIAVRNISNALPDLLISTYQIDFEVGPFSQVMDSISQESSYPKLLLFLGHTIGNPLDRQRTLINIHDSMRAGDILVIGLELYQPDRIAEVLAHYHNEPFYRAVFNSLTFAGFRRDDGLLEVTFNQLTRNVEVRFRLEKDISVCVENTEVIDFKRGEELLIFLSHRFEEAELQDLLASAGLGDLAITFNHDLTYALIFAAQSD